MAPTKTAAPVLDMQLAEKQEPAALPATVPVSPALDLIQRFAADPNFDVTKLQALMDMREREMNRVAQQEFNAAFAKMQPRIPIIGEKGRTNMGTYAPREDIVEVITPILAEFGFALSFKTTYPDGKILVTGKLKHAGGHCEESEFLTDADKSGSKNDVQARGSATEYGRRYTTCDLLNIATRKADDDGKRAGRALPEGFDKWLESLQDAALAGSKALTERWQKSAKPLQDAILAKEWEAIKAVAKKSDEAAHRG